MEVVEQGDVPAIIEPAAIAATLNPTPWTFLAEHGRLPRIGDEVPPWRYRGWLLWYCQAGHAAVPDTGNRWDYWLRTLEAGELLPEPIPQVEFNTTAVGQSNSAPVKSIESSLRIIEQHGNSTWDSFRIFIDWLGWALGTIRHEPRLDEDANEKLYRSFNLEPWLQNPGDHLGEFLAARKASGWNPNAFFPTPHCICEMMVRMLMPDPVAVAPEFIGTGPQGALPDGRDARLMTVNDPALGTGRMLMHASNVSFCLSGQDVDALVCEITKINGALYVPWLAFPMPKDMEKRCVARRYRIDDAGDELPPFDLLSGAELPEAPTAYPDLAGIPDTIPLEELAVVAEAVVRARELVQALHEEPEDPAMPTDKRGQGLLFDLQLPAPPARRKKPS